MIGSNTRMLLELQEAVATYEDWADIDLVSPLHVHIAIMSEPFLSYVMNGKKTVESRFSLRRIVPYERVSPGDIVFMKGGMIMGYFVISWVKYIDLAEEDIVVVAKEYGDAICANEIFWKQKADKQYGTLLGIREVHIITPIKISKFDRRAWVEVTA